MPVYLIRHPVPQIASGICYGQSDLTVDVTEREAVLARLLPQLPSYCHIMTSPLRRCADLATALCGALAATANSGEATMVPQSDPRLMELNFGDWENQAWDRIPRAEIDAWADHPVTYAPGGGESVLAMSIRIADFMRELQQKQQNSSIVANCVLICHAGSIRQIRAYQCTPEPMQMAQHVLADQRVISYGECVVLHWH